MKNLMVFINPKKKFEGEAKIAVKIQIDNSLRLGWKKEDIILVTNFPYKYRGVHSLIVEDDAYCTYFPRCSKWGTIIKLFKKNLIEKDALYWYHDFDAYQLRKIKESEIPENADMALCDYGPGYHMWCGGSIFFRKNAHDIFTRTKELMDSYKSRSDGVECDEVALYKLRNVPDIKARVQKLNIRYNLHSRRIAYTYPAADKPIKIVHCHFDHAGFFLHAENRLKIQLAPNGLVTIFRKHGIETSISPAKLETLANPASS